VGTFISASSTTIEALLEALHTMLSKYKLMESGLVENRRALRAKMPDISASLDAVRLLEEKAAAGAEFDTYFALADQVHAKAHVAPGGTVCLWLGANVMLEYPYAEARELLETNLRNAELKVAETAEELDVLREQIITTEVRRAGRRARPRRACGARARALRLTRRPPAPPPQVNMARTFNYDVVQRRAGKVGAE